MTAQLSDTIWTYPLDATEPPLGSTVIDSECKVWQRKDSKWVCMTAGHTRTATWHEMQQQVGPLVPASVGLR